MFGNVGVADPAQNGKRIALERARDVGQALVLVAPENQFHQLVAFIF